jgi:hypothetical protein
VTKQEKIIVSNIPYDDDGIGVNYFKIDFKYNPNLELSAVKFKNSSSETISFITNIETVSGGVLNVDSLSEAFKNFNGSTFWCYIFGNSNTGAEIELIYNTVGLEVEEE